MVGTGAKESFGERLRRYRERAALTQEELAERAGLTAMAISALERGERRRPYPNTVRALADALGLGEGDRGALVAAVPRRSDSPPAAVVIEENGHAASTLPAVPTALLGRDDELGMLREQLLTPDVRLLTIVGPGGVGKTRLATAVCRALDDDPAFPDGLWFIDLSATREPSHVPATVARTLRAADTGTSTPMPALERFLAQRRMLLVLDNFEHVLPAAAQVGRLLAASPGLTVLVTSREPLRLRWERALPLSPLALPDPRHLPPLDRLAAVAAVALFVERARAVAPGFDLTQHNAPAIAELCVRLDGLPLAIELVAARTAQLGASVTLDRLARRLPLPTSSMQDAPARQQSLRATLQWSLDLLDAPEQALLRRVAVFAGGWTLAAAEAVAGHDVPDVLSGLTSLADKSLVVVPGPTASDESRFRILETVREFALELLEGSGEADTARRRHATYFATIAEEMAPQLQGPGQVAVAMRLEREEDNFQQALGWALGQSDAEAREQGLRLAGALGWYWFMHGYPAQARDWFQALLDPALAHEEPPSAAGRAAALRARALNAAGFQATNQGEYITGYSLHEQALATWRQLRDTAGMVASLHGVADNALWQGDPDRARAHYEEGLALARATASAEDVALFTYHLGLLYWLLDDLATAETYAREALSVARGAGSTTWPPYALYVQASVAHERGDTARAGSLYRESLKLAWEHHDRLGVRMVLPGLAGLAVSEGDAARAVRLAGAASALEEDAGIWAFPPIKARHERWLAAAEQSLDAQARAAAWAEGRGMSLDQAIAHAVEEPATTTSVRNERGVARDGGLLSPREREVLTMVANGKSNREIAEALVVTEHTAKYHVASLLNKLGAASRAEAVTRAVALGLLSPTR